MRSIVRLGFLLLFAQPALAITSADFLTRVVDGDGGSGFELPYRIYVPAACAGRRCPVMLFLHGAGETGSNNTAQLGNRANGAFALAELAEAQGDPAILVAPQAPEWWANDGPSGGLGDLLDDVQREFGFDPARVYVSGLSMGGAGTIGFIQRFDAVAAAVAPICPAGQITSPNDRDRLSSTPAWYFHAVNDSIVTVANSRNSVATLRSGAGDPIYTEYAVGNHSIWTQSYNNPRLTDWLLAQRWRAPMVARDPRVVLTQPSNAAVLYTNAASISIAGTTAEASAAVSLVNYEFGSSSGAATGTTSFVAGPLNVPTNAQTALRLTATGSSYVAALAGNTTFSRSVRVISPTPSNAAPAAALWIEPIVRVGTAVRIRAMVADDGQPLGQPGVILRQLEGPASDPLQIDATNPALAWWTPSAPGLYRFEVEANDGQQTRSAGASVLVLTAGATRPTVSAVNVGGPAYTGLDGVNFAAETGFTGGTVETLTTGVTTIYGSEDDSLHRSMRRGNASYTAPITNGRYLVVLYLSEWRSSAAVSRGMDVSVEGVSMLQNFDLYRWAGLRHAMRMAVAVDVVDGAINVQMSRSAGTTTDPRIDAIEILALPTLEQVFRNGFE